jgi:hypothetical protein
MAISAMQAISGAQMAPTYDIDGTAMEDGSPASMAAIIAKAQRIVGEDAMEVASEQLAEDLRNMQMNRKSRLSAAVTSYREEKAAAWTRLWTGVAALAVSMAGSAVQVAGAARASMKSLKAVDLQRRAKTELKCATSAMESASTPADRSAAGLRLESARDGFDAALERATKLSDSANTLRFKSEAARQLGDSTGRFCQSVGDVFATSHDVNRKAADLGGQMSDGNAQMSADMAQRRRGDLSAARKANDDVNQLLVEIERVNARNVLV